MNVAAPRIPSRLTPGVRDMSYLDNDAPHWIYRWFDSDGTVIYIGMTCDPKARIRAHRNSADWIGWAARVEVQQPQIVGRRAAYAAESQAIRDEMPPFNRLPGRAGAGLVQRSIEYVTARGATPPWGEDHPFTSEQIEEMCAASAAGEHRISLAERFSTHTGIITALTRSVWDPSTTRTWRGGQSAASIG